MGSLDMQMDNITRPTKIQPGLALLKVLKEELPAEKEIEKLTSDKEKIVA